MRAAGFGLDQRPRDSLRTVVTPFSGRIQPDWFRKANSIANGAAANEHRPWSAPRRTDRGPTTLAAVGRKRVYGPLPNGLGVAPSMRPRRRGRARPHPVQSRRTVWTAVDGPRSPVLGGARFTRDKAAHAHAWGVWVGDGGPVTLSPISVPLETKHSRADATIRSGGGLALRTSRWQGHGTPQR